MGTSVYGSFLSGGHYIKFGRKKKQFVKEINKYYHYVGVNKAIYSMFIQIMLQTTDCCTCGHHRY